MKKTTKKKAGDIEIDMPDTFEGEVSVFVDHTGVAPLTQEFSNGDMNVLRDKINELIARG